MVIKIEKIASVIPITHFKMLLISFAALEKDNSGDSFDIKFIIITATAAGNIISQTISTAAPEIKSADGEYIAPELLPPVRTVNVTSMGVTTSTCDFKLFMLSEAEDIIAPSSAASIAIITA